MEFNYNSDIIWQLAKNLDNVPNWYALSGYKLVTWDIVQQNLNCGWNWGKLSKNLSITWDIIKNNPYYVWNWYEILLGK